MTTTTADSTAELTANRIESLLSARLFLEPQLVGDRLFFVSNLSGHLSLYAMDVDGSVPEPLLPPQIALQNPDLVGGHLFHVLPRLERIIVMIDADGDENYVPYVVPLEGGFPERLAGETFSGCRAHLTEVDDETETAYFAVESREESLITAMRLDLAGGAVETLAQSPYGAFVAAWTPDHSRVIHADGYTMGDVVLYESDRMGARRLLYGTPIEERDPETEPELTGFRSSHGTATGSGVLLATTLFDDTGSLGYLDLEQPGVVEPVAISGLVHEGVGELERIQHLEGDRYALVYNIDGCSWVYDANLDEPSRTVTVTSVLVGQGELADGVLHGLHYDTASRRFAMSFCTAIAPTQLYVLDAGAASKPVRRTNERALGLAPELLSSGEDASFESHDGLRISARLYLPSPELGFGGPSPLVYYVHGGPQSQERPNFAWFSMPLIQILTLEGFAVFVPNARGSTGYGLDYAKRVDHDWGGLDRLDHVHALTEVLPKDG